MKDAARNIKTTKDETKIVSMPLTGKNFGLTESEFKYLVVQLKSGNEYLFEQIFLAHFEDCMEYLMKQYKLKKEQAYDVSMDALILFRKKLVQDKISYGNLRYLFTKIASQLFIKGKQKDDRLIDVNYFLTDHDEHKENMFEILEQSWDKLPESDQDLLRAFYYDKKPLIKIGESIGMSDSAMRKRKQRCLQSLRRIFLNLLSIQNGKS